jgi:DNA-binding CsgD family transcriptional regulator/PAS domain-containing protein
MQFDLEEFVLRIYDTVADTNLWQPVLNEFVDRIGAHGCIIFEWEGADEGKHLTAPIFSGSYTNEALKIYLQRYQHLEARDQAVLRDHTSTNDRIELIDDTVLAKSTKELRQQEHVKRLSKLGIFHRAAGVLNKDNQWISLFSVQLNSTRRQLDDEERSCMALLLPHFAKALDLGLPMRQLERRSQSIIAAIDHLTIGICILDRNGNIVLKNDEFARQQDTSRAFEVGTTGKLRMRNGLDQKRFENLKDDVRHHGQFGARPRKEAVSTSADNYLCVEITPLSHAGDIGSKAFDGFIVCSTDTSLPVQCATSAVQHAFKLTGAEMNLVDAICQGLTNPEIAALRGRSVLTINAQVKSMLSKSQCATRTQFVRMVMRFGASFLTPRE